MVQWLEQKNRLDEYGDHTLSIKFIVTHTKDLSDPKAIEIIKQVFCDYHISLKRPTQSQSKFYNNSSPFYRFCNALLQIDCGDKKLINYIALNGIIKRGQLWNYEQYAALVLKFLGLTPAGAIKQLVNEEDYEDTFFICESFLQKIISALPVHSLDVEDFADPHDSSMFTKSIFAHALGYVGKALFAEMLVDENASWDKICPLSIPINDKQAPFWQTEKITWNDEGSVKIIRDTAKRMAAVLCLAWNIHLGEEQAA